MFNLKAVGLVCMLASGLTLAGEADVAWLKAAIEKTPPTERRFASGSVYWEQVLKLCQQTERVYRVTREFAEPELVVCRQGRLQFWRGLDKMPWLSHEVPVVNGQRHGLEKSYRESGVLSFETPYVNGQQHGIKKFYVGAAGVGWFEIPYVNGQQHGIEKGYNESGVLSFEMSYVNNQRHGRARGFDQQGNLESETTYHEGQFVQGRLKRIWYRGGESNKTYFEATRTIEDGLCVDRDRSGKELGTYAVGSEGRCK
jgi:hypothetical protein